MFGEGSFVIENYPNVVVYQTEFVFSPDWHSATFEPLVTDRLVQGDILVKLLTACVGVLRGNYCHGGRRMEGGDRLLHPTPPV